MIIPTILTDDAAEGREKITTLQSVVERIQIDVVDGEFAANKTIQVADLLGLEGVDEAVKLDWHLMVEEPVSYLKKDWPGATGLVCAHIEAMPSQIEFVRTAKEDGFRVGLAVDLKTSLDELDEEAVDLVEQVLLLGVEAGRGGQEIDPQILIKIKELYQWRQRENWQFRIGVDGGVDERSLAFCKKMGADDFCVGSAIWEADNPVEKLEELRGLIG